MDNNQNSMQQMYGQDSQQMYGQAPQAAPMAQQPQMYGQDPQTMYGQAPQAAPMTQQSQMYGQAPMNQTMYGQTPVTQYGQMYGQPGYNNGYNPYKQPKAAGDFVGNVKKAKNEFKGKVSKMGISIYCLIGVIAAMLCIFGPFMNFASIHVSTKVDTSEMLGSSYDYYDYGYGYDDYDDFDFGGKKGKAAKAIKLRAADGMNLFELSKLSGSASRVFKQAKIDKSELVAELDMAESLVTRYKGEFEREYDVKIKNSSIKEVFGTANLLIKGRLALLLTPYIILLCGIGLFFFTIINKKIAKIVFAAVPLVCILWLMICSTHFFSLMGIGAWAIILGSALGLVSAFLDKTASN